MFACESSDWGKIEFVTEYLNVLTSEPLADYKLTLGRARID